MAAIFSQILNMSMTGSVVILLVILARFLLKQSPKIFSYALWSVVLFRLLCPVAFTAPVSVLDMVEPELKETSNNTSIVSYIPATVNTQADFIMVQPEEQQVQKESVTEPEERLLMTPMHAIALVWAAGMVGMMLYSVAQYLGLRRKLVGSVQLKGNIYLADHIDTAFVVGLLQPRIYLPSGVPEKERYYILAHEQHHIRRGDHIIKLLAYLALCIHWFNPLVWLAFVLAGKDMEMSCDEAVIKKLGPEIRADYSASLLRLATHKKILSGMPLAFGEGDTKGRVLNMAKWKKPAKWVVAICVILCLCVVVVCAFNPEEEKTIEELTNHTSDGPVGTGIDDLYFTYPAGLTSEMREVEHWTRDEQKRILDGQRNRGQYDHFFIDNGVDFGGVVDFIVPEDREIRLEELKLPSEWVGLDYIAESSSYPYAEMEYTLIKDGKDYIQMYLYTYSGRGYFLWFYTEQGDPAHKEAILQSVELGGGSRGKTKTECDEPVSLGQFNMKILKGYGYYRNGTVILEITRKELLGEQVVVGCVTARPNPNLPLETDADWVQWVETVGLDLHREDPNYGYTITDHGEFGDISLTLEEKSDQKLLRSERHYFYIAGDIVYHIWFDAMEMNWTNDKQMLESIWIKDDFNIPDENKWVTAAGESPVQIGDLPDGYNYGFDGDQNIVFAWGDSAVGGVKSYPIPAGLYDPEDGVFLWLEEMGIPDYEDPDLIYLGGITSGNYGWAAEFADELDEGKRTVYRRHSFQVAGDTLYDIWFDRMKISFDDSYEIRKAISIPQPQEETESYMPTVPSDGILTDAQLIQYGSLHFSLPDGMEAADENGSIALTFDGRDIGGIALRHPEQPNSPDSFSRAWQAAMGVPEASKPMAYMGGGSLYADYETTYSLDVALNYDENGNIIRDELGILALESEVTHYFFIHENDIYDIWLYDNRLPNKHQESLLKSCYIEGVTDLAAMEAARTEEEEALAKCRAVLEAVQSGSYKIVTRQTSGRNESAVSYEQTYSRNDRDWLSITNVLPMGADFNDAVEYAATKSTLYAKGQRFQGAGSKWVLSGKQEDTRLPWLADFAWDDKLISYQGTMEDSGEVFIMLRVDEKYIDSDEYAPHYFVDFAFTPEGDFVSARISVNLFQDNQQTITESLITLDPQSVNAEIQKEYRNATGKSMTRQLPENPNYAVLEFMDDGLIVITNHESVEGLLALFADAEPLEGEPEKHNIGVDGADLNLVFVEGSEEFVIGLDPGTSLCRINGAYLWYGKPDSPDALYDLWEYMGITRWPDIIYQVCKSARKP